MIPGFCRAPTELLPIKNDHVIARSWACVLFAALMLTATRSHGQFPLQASERAGITPPRLKKDVGVVYPAEALRERIYKTIEVDLVLGVDADGHVQSVDVSESRGHGFDEAAVTAARQLTFEPATRNGKPVAARIKYRYVFTPPATRLTVRVASLVTDAALAGASISVRDSADQQRTLISERDGSVSLEGLPAGPVHLRATKEGSTSQEIDSVLVPGEEATVVLRLAPLVYDEPKGNQDIEIVVKGERPPREVTRRTLSRDEIVHSAGTQGDALLSLQNLPGVARPPPFSGALAVRGSAPEDTPVLIDGTEVPLIYHFGGLTSVVPTEMLDRVDFYPGNYSARYGRGMGGIVDVKLRAPNPGHHLIFENSVLGLRLLAEGPITHGFSFFIAGQRSWLDWVVTPLLKSSGAEQTAMPRWADYQAAILKDFGATSSFRVLFFGSDDSFDVVNPIPNSSDPTLGGALGYHTNFWRIQGRYENHISNVTDFHLRLAYGQDTLRQSLGTNLVDATLHPLSLRTEVTGKVHSKVVANVGLDVVYEPYEYALQLPAASRAGEPSGGPGQTPTRSVGSNSLLLPGAYCEFELSPWLGTRLVPALRFDYDKTTGTSDVSPRLNVRHEIISQYPRFAVKGGVGLYYQPPSPLQTDQKLGQAGLSSNRSLQTDIGFEQELTRNVELSLDIFYKRFENLVVPGEKNSGSGLAYGVEWFLRYKPDKNFFGWVSYTLSRSDRRDLPGEPLSRFVFDQTHVLTMLGNYKLGHGWQLGARFRLTSGNPYTTMTTGAYDATVGSQVGVQAFPPNNARLPAFNQLDVRIEKMREYAHFRWTWFLDLQNAYFANNPLGVSYNYNYTRSAFVNGLPILPIIGVRGEVK